MYQQFTFESKQKALFLGLIGVGILSAVLTMFMGGEYASMRFWSNFLHNAVFFTGIAFMAMFLLAAKVLAYSGWHTVFKRIWEAYALFLPLGLAFLLVIVAGVFTHWHHLYHWAAPGVTETDDLLASKSGFLNSTVYAFGTVAIVAAWSLFAFWYRRLSLSEDKSGDASFSHHRKMRFLGALFLPIGGFTSAAVIWLWLMSIDAHWYSTMYAWYTTASWLVSAIALTLLTIIYLKSKGYLEQVTANHVHDLGKYLFGFSIFWTYLWFSQFMLIWYSNVGEETIYFKERMDKYPVLFFGNLVINFLLPFFVLMRNDTKRKLGTVGFVALFVFFGHWFDFFQMVKPGALINIQEHMAHAHGHDAHGDADHSGDAHGTTTLDAHAADAQHATAEHGEDAHATDAHAATAEHGEDAHATDAHAATAEHGEDAHATDAHAATAEHNEDAHATASADVHGHEGGHFHAGFTIPGLLEVGMMLGFLGLFLYVAFANLAKASLIPTNDPYLKESLNHHV